MKITAIFKKIKNEIITIELKNGIILNGSVENVDPYMNIYLKHVKRTFKGKNSNIIPTISVRGSRIRFIILPDWINFDNVFKKD
jgi:small nuclear ribonucleoprotein D1